MDILFYWLIIIFYSKVLKFAEKLIHKICIIKEFKIFMLVLKK